MQQAYLIIDMQNDFIDGTLGTKEAQAIVPRVEKALQTAKRDENNDTDFIFTQDTHDEDYLDNQEGHHLPIMHCLKDSHGWNITKALMPYTLMAEILEKPTFGCTDLVQEVAPYDRLVLMGLCTDICVISNALLLKAYFPEKEIAVLADCCAGSTPENHDIALKAMENCQITIIR